MQIRSKVPTQAYRNNFDQIDWGTSDNLETVRQDNLEMGKAPMVIHDIQPYQAPDGTVIKSRKHREQYMKRNNLAIADDFTDHWAKSKTDRALREKGAHPEQIRERKRALSEAIEHARDKSRYNRY